MHKRKHFRRGILGDTISYTYLTILALLAAFPLFWILVSSVKSKGELTANPTAIFPQVFSLEYYKIVFEQLKFGTNIMNSVVVAGSTTIIAILISALGAYDLRTQQAISRLFKDHLHCHDFPAGVVTCMAHG